MQITFPGAARHLKHHLRHNLGRAACSMLITDFQAQRTPGRRLADGTSQVRVRGGTHGVTA
jgi:metallo-beta-lactamase family protein